MKFNIIILILLLIVIPIMIVGCLSTNTETKEYTMSRVTKFIDEESNVTCWVYNSYNSGGISCLPNQYINQ